MSLHQHHIELPEGAEDCLIIGHADTDEPDVVLNALQGRLVSLRDKCERLQAKADKQCRPLTADEQTLFDSFYAEFEQVEAAIDERNASAAVVPQRRTEPTPFHSTGGRIHRSHEPGGGWGSHSKLFNNAEGRGTDHGFQSLGEFLFALRQTVAGHFDKRLQQPHASYSEGSGADGGFLVPPAFRADVLGPAIVESGVLNRVNTVPMPNGNLAVAGMNTQDNSGGAIGGLTLTWTGEGDQLTEHTPKVRTINLKAKKGTIFVNASNELLMDAPAAPDQLRRLFIEAARYGLEKAILTGNGAGRPLGVLSASALISVAKESGQAADTFQRENAVSMLSRLHPSLVQNAVWVANPSLLPQLLNLQFRIDNAASSDYVGGSQEPVSVSAGQYQLFGIPLVFSEALPTLGDAGDILLCDFSQYILGMTLQMGIDVSPHARFEYDETQFRLRVRVDGQPAWSSAMTPENGNTLSPFVGLDARA